MPTMVNTIVKCCNKRNVDTFCPEFEAPMSGTANNPRQLQLNDKIVF
jgi:hypothetical protein